MLIYFSTRLSNGVPDLMLSERKQAEREARKARIVEAALMVFQEKGIEAAKMEEIATKAGFGRATLYYYFPAKEDVFTYIFEMGWTQLWNSIDAVIEQDARPRERFMNILHAAAKVVMADRALFAFLFSAPKVATQNRDWKSYQDRLYAVLRGLLEDGIAAGEFPDMPPGVLMRAVGGVFHGLLFLGDGKRQVRSEDVEALVERILTVSPEPN